MSGRAARHAVADRLLSGRGFREWCEREGIVEWQRTRYARRFARGVHRAYARCREP